MARKLDKNRRQFRRFAFEHCEPRQMLSVAEIPSPQTELVGQYQTIQSGIGVIYWSAGANGTVLGVSGSEFTPVIINAYGNFNGVIASDAYFRSNFIGSDLQGHFKGIGRGANDMQTIRAPQLDLIGMPAPTSPPAKSVQPEPIAAPQPVVTPEPITGRGRIAARAPDSVRNTQNEAVSSGSSLTSVADDSRGEWVPVTFSPLEHHRLDASSQHVDDELAMATLERQSRSTLEPTRVTSQTFCVVAYAQRPEGDGANRPSTAVAGRGDDGTEDVRAVWQSEDIARPEPVSKAKSPAVHDAAILEWSAAERLLQGLPSVAAGAFDQIGPLRESSPGKHETLADDASRLRRVTDRLFDENSHFIGALLAAIAVNVLWSYGNRDTESDARPQLKLAGRSRRPLDGSQR